MENVRAGAMCSMERCGSGPYVSVGFACFGWWFLFVEKSFTMTKRTQIGSSLNKLKFLIENFPCSELETISRHLGFRENVRKHI